MLLFMKLVGQQSNGYDCGVYLCMFSAVMFFAREVSVCFEDVTLSNGLLEAVTTSNKYFEPTDNDCALFRMELRALLERLKLLKERKEETISNINSPTLTASDTDGAEFPLEHGAYVSISERHTHVYEMMKKQFYEQFDPIYQRNLERGTTIITKTKYDHIVEMLLNADEIKKAPKKTRPSNFSNYTNRYYLGSNVESRQLYCQSTKNGST
jgi:hypothetical protein